MPQDWPFDDQEDLAVFTLDRIMDGSRPILYVTHDSDDGGWQFLDGDEVTMTHALLVALRTIARHDPTILELADLPVAGSPSAMRSIVPGSVNRALVDLDDSETAGDRCATVHR